MSELLDFPHFVCDDEISSLGPRWRKWVDRLELYFTGKDIKAKARKFALMLHFAGEQVYDVYQTIKDDNDDYDELKRKLEEHFAPKQNTLYETYKLRQEKQLAHESLDHFVTRLKAMAEFCEFGAFKERELILQVLFGCKELELRRKILQKKTDELSLDEILAIGRSIERVKVQEAEIRGEKNETVNAVSSKRKCRSCGFDWPHDGVCPAKEKKCRACNHIGHFKRCCPKNEKVNQILQTTQENDDTYFF